ncbi:N-acetylglucosaminyl-phosphatidylinositol de-N-acetylase isoform X2 [Amyelois transitella]|uniref:N-acetylglucosaminyl-phosphatidylinositol de-N-acetylase isoform X2 n=1 Tax=Amyelois transitella TaxID=680683 RepID=UPI0029907871|nr:N-acetylglucosaminyl-phosphatidylinositol de-N-acetylase isoform X2 [Amyelois transitella]
MLLFSSYYYYDFDLFYTFYLKFLAETLLYFRNFALYISIWFLCYILVCGVVYRRYARRLPTRTRGSLRAKRVLVVVAHPDDECMFFGPTIFRLCEQGADVHILCLSNGNYEGKGHVRRKELWDACKELGIPDRNICLINDTRLKDHPKVNWPVPVISKLMQHHLEMLDVDTLVTFDRGGVSSHANHSAVFYAVAYMFVEKLMPKKCTVYTLDSVNILRKYLGFFDLPMSFILSSKRYFLRWTESRRVVRAMKRHKSQMVWFRHLYVCFSRYMVINTLRRISLADIELELEVDD